MPRGFEERAMPQGFEKRAMPQGFEKRAMLQGFEKRTMPQGFERELHEFGRVGIRGLTWVEVLATLTILGILLAAGIPSWRALQTQQAERRLLHDVERALAFVRNQAFLRAETLVLLPRVASEGWSSGMVLEAKQHTSDAHNTERLHEWRWHDSRVHLSWHGFLGDDALVVAHSPAKLAMNGYFLLENSGSHPTRWVVNRFGRIRVLRKHVD